MVYRCLKLHAFHRLFHLSLFSPRLLYHFNLLLECLLRLIVVLHGGSGFPDVAIVDFEGGLEHVGGLDGLREALLYVDIIDLEACAEHDVQVLVGVQTDLVLILVQI